MTIWYILCSFGTFFQVLVSFTKKNLATLFGTQPNILSHLFFLIYTHNNNAYKVEINIYLAMRKFL
jgi:hypothetical protein